LGPLPIEDAKACRINIYSDHRFDVACGNLDWVGAGHYETAEDRLTLRFAAWVRRGQVQRRLPELKLSFIGEGNTLKLGQAGGSTKPMVWHRAKP